MSHRVHKAYNLYSRYRQRCLALNSIAAPVRSVPDRRRSSCLAGRHSHGIFSITCSILLMPLSANVTSGWFHTQRKAHSARLLCMWALSHKLPTEGGILAKRPHKPVPSRLLPGLFCAYSNPRVPGLDVYHSMIIILDLAHLSSYIIGFDYFL